MAAVITSCHLMCSMSSPANQGKRLVPQDLTYQTFRNTYGAVWEASNLPPSPLDIRLTDPAGHSVVARCCTSIFSCEVQCGIIPVHQDDASSLF